MTTAGLLDALALLALIACEAACVVLTVADGLLTKELPSPYRGV